MNTIAPPPRKYDNAPACGRGVLDRQTMAKSMFPLILLAGFVALALMVAEAVQQTRAAIGASAPSVSEQQPERSGVLSARMPLF